MNQISNVKIKKATLTSLLSYFEFNKFNILSVEMPIFKKHMGFVYISAIEKPQGVKYSVCYLE